MAKGSRYNKVVLLVVPSRKKGVVAINTTPAGTVTRQGSLAQWIKRTQEVLAHRSLQGRTFHQLYNLCCTKRLIEHALMKVLQNTGAQTAGVDGVTKHKLSSDDQQRLIDEVWQDMKAKTCCLT